jgi:hypothetical protein
MTKIRKGQAPASLAPDVVPGETPVTGVEHWTHKDGVRLFLWEKFVGSPDGKPALLFVHGSSMASQPTFDLTVPGGPTLRSWTGSPGAASFAGAWTWKVMAAPTGRGDITCDIANGADDWPPRQTTSQPGEASAT